MTSLFLLSSFFEIVSYGPYMGTVVDKETNEPIEGAVVFMRFYTEGAFQLHQLADAVETLTDQQGEFYFPVRRVFTVPVPLGNWEPADVIIFKPGYGAYPGHKEAVPLFIPNGTIPENQHVTIKLPKLKTREERRRNLRNISYIDAPIEKYKTLKEYEKNETDYCYEK